ncbi:MAG TPA: hypothetical protein P5042_06360, partial [Candidatus Izemoplasmatales bacterium]|nr:hypothetical protein [Candidatus Izemoplasmatales bacterium]
FSWVGYKRKCIEYEFIPRKYGKSSWSFKSLFKYAFNGMNQFSTLMMLLPVIAWIASLLIAITDALLFGFGVLTLSEFIIGLFIFVSVFVTGTLAYGTIYLLYQIRKQTLERPIYLIDETSEE